MAKKQTKNKKAWNREVKRIKDFMRRAGKRGYTFEANIIPETPKRITAQAIERLKELTPNVLYLHATYKEPETGRTIKGTKGRQAERRKAGQKAVVTKKKNKLAKTPQAKTIKNIPRASTQVLDKVRENINKWSPDKTSEMTGLAEIKERDKNTLSSLLDGAINNEGEDVVAQRLEQHAERVQEIVFHVLYASDEEFIQTELAEFMEIVYSRPLTVDEAKEIADMQEYFEGDELL